MLKKLDLELSLTFREYDDMSAVIIKVPYKSLCDWNLCLQLLLNKLVDMVIIKSQCATLKLVYPVQLTSVIASDQGSIECRISEADLVYVASFFLKYYRDGYAEVSHIDVQVEINSMKDGYLTIEVDRFADPISEVEVNKLLGISKNKR